jgi:hypothetical protein
MSANLPDVPPPPGGAAVAASDGNDINSQIEDNRCALCNNKFIEKVQDQWLRTYDGRELWLTDVKIFVHPEGIDCGVTMYPEESLAYFERARNNEIPDLKSRVYVPDTYDDDE